MRERESVGGVGLGGEEGREKEREKLRINHRTRKHGE